MSRHRAPDAAPVAVGPLAPAAARPVSILQLGVTVHDTAFRRALPPVPSPVAR